MQNKTLPSYWWLNNKYKSVFEYLPGTNPFFYKDPFEHAVINDFFSNEFMSLLLEVLYSKDLAWEEIESSPSRIIGTPVPPSDLFKVLYGSELKNFIYYLSGKHVSLRKSSCFHLRKMISPCKGIPIHTDEDSGVSMVFLLQLTKDWMQEYGGELVLHKKVGKDFSENKRIVPSENTLSVIFFGQNSFHSVNSMQKHWERTILFGDFINC